LAQVQNNLGRTINPIERITALWALSEAALGGVLHALRIPFTGLFIGSSAVIFITLIAFFNDQRGAILKATLLVMIVKAIVSPHSPVNAYLALAFQGIMGEILFLLFPSKRIAAFLLGFLSLLESSIQKILIITIVFGQTIWEAIDLFSEYVINQFFITTYSDQIISISMLLIIIYMSIHLCAGIIIGLWSPQLAIKVKKQIQHEPDVDYSIFKPLKTVESKSKQGRKVWKTLSITFIILLASTIFILSYFVPVFEKSKGYAALLMLFRSIMIMSIWYFLLGPFLLKYLRKFLDKKSIAHKNEVNDILNIFPATKQVIGHAWTETNHIKLYRRIPQFVMKILIYSLSLDLQRISKLK
jgi:hypothetical protein